MSSEEELQRNVEGLIKSITITMDPQVSHEQRTEAYHMYEEFKEKSELCVQCGMVLAKTTYPPIIRHFGLQLLEHCVKFRWLAMNPNQKMIFKDATVSLIRTGVQDILEEETFIKDGLSRIMVEMIKKEWPQRWESMLQELGPLSRCGSTQCEMVLLVLLRLVEDVVSFQNFDQKRRKDIMAGLQHNMTDLLEFMFGMLQDNCNMYKQAMETNGRNSHEVKIASKLTNAALETIAGFVEWIALPLVFLNDCALPQTLYQLLQEPELRNNAAEILSIIVNRKDRLKDRQPLNVMFSKNAMVAILSSAEIASQEAVNEQNYIFLKKICRCVTGMGFQMCALWGASDSDGKSKKPENFKEYLSALMAFTGHASVHLSQMTLATWSLFFRTPIIAQDPCVHEVLPRFLKIVTVQAQKVAEPSMMPSPKAEYFRLDFDSEDEFMTFFATYRSLLLEEVRHCNNICPLLTFQVAEQWLKETLVEPLKYEPGKTVITNSSPSFLQWDALTCFMESAMPRVLKGVDAPVAQGEELLKQVLAYQTADALISSCVLSCVSTLFPLIRHVPQYLSPILDKLFSGVTFTVPGQSKNTRTRSVQNVRRHACSALIKMCRDSPELVMPEFEKIYAAMKELSADPHQLTQLEKVALYEALILLSNQFKDYNRQTEFLAGILKPICDVWLSDELTLGISTPENFISFVGLEKYDEEDPNGINRAHIIGSVQTIVAVTKRCTWPENFEEAKAGGFIQSMTNNGMPIYRNPCTPLIAKLLNNVLILTKTLNALWSQEIQDKVYPGFKQAYEMMECDRQALLGSFSMVGSCDAPILRTLPDKLQSFLTMLHDLCYHTLAGASHCLGYEFYASPGLAEQLLSTTFTNLDMLPDHKLRPLIRVFMKAFVANCPPEFYSTVIVPVLTGVAAYMLKRLSQCWELLHQKNSVKSDDDEPEKEVLEDQIVKHITKDYLEFLRGVFRQKKTSSEGNDDMETETHHQPSNKDSEAEHLSDLGKVIFKTEGLIQNITLLVYSALSFEDSNVYFKASGLTMLLLQELPNSNMLPEAVNHLFIATLRALQVHGHHESCISAIINNAIYHYDLFRPKYPKMVEVLLQVPGVNRQAVEAYDNKVLTIWALGKNLPEKKKKDHFKKIVHGLIKEVVSEKFKKEVTFGKLPPIYRPQKAKAPRVDETSEEYGLIQLFKD
ncbi:exportin-5-like [Anneissia japonica]|uniref:exportin-5-like n=1 Tax=Anneissia japonica TaxID=1529436 RepID=UPI001425B910|nr:exportin-5-like [Anneissia japonica]